MELLSVEHHNLTYSKEDIDKFWELLNNPNLNILSE